MRELFREPFFLISFALGCAIVIMMGYDIVHHQIKRKKSPPQSVLEPIAMMGEENSPMQDWVSEINAIGSISGSINGRTGEGAGGVLNAGTSGDLGSVRPRTETPSMPSADAMGEILFREHLPRRNNFLLSFAMRNRYLTERCLHLIMEPRECNRI